MADIPEWISQALSRLNPVNVARRVGSNFRQGVGEFRRHPGQEVVQHGLRAVPFVGGVLSNLADKYFDNRNYRNDYVHRSPEERGSQFGGIGDMLGLPDYTSANPISYGGMSGITSPQRGNYPTPQGPQQSALASLLGLNNYQGNSPGSGLPGITSPNTFDGSPSYGMSGGLGIQNYAYGNPTISPYLSGNFSQSQSPRLLPLIDMDYGQNPDIVLNQDGGLPGITGPNIYSGTPSAPTGLDAMSGGGARDAFAGTSGSSDWGNTFASLGMLGSSGGSHNSMGGPTAIADNLAGHSALRNRLRERLRQNPNDQSALALREQMIANRSGSL